MITNASYANAPYLGSLPMGITHFGGDTQIFPIETSNPNTGMQIFGANGQYQTVGTGRNLAQPNPYAIINQAQGMLAETLNKLTSANIDSALGGVITQKNQLIAKYNSENASNELKTVIQEQVKQLENLERQLNYLKANGGQLDPQTAYQRSEYIKKSATDLINLSTVTVKAMETQATQAAQQAQQAEQAESSQHSEDSEEVKAQKVKEDNIYTRAGENDLDPQSVQKEYYETMVEDLHKAMEGWGTDDKLLESTMDKINKSNVLELMFFWNQKYPNESFMEMFMADAGPMQKKDYGIKVADALKGAAEDLGVDLSKDPDMQAIEKEVHNSWFWINNDVADNYNNVIQKLLGSAGVDYQYSPYSMFSKAA